jgi:hypothetical protein
MIKKKEAAGGAAFTGKLVGSYSICYRPRGGGLLDFPAADY